MGGRACAGVLFLLLGASWAWALVLHPGQEPNSSWTDRPSNVVVGSWAGGASVVVISPNWIVTVRHTGGGVGTTVTIGGQGYRVAAIYNEPEADGKTADLRVCRLERLEGGPANLGAWAPLYTGAWADKPTVVGGTGWGRGGAFSDSDGVGYSWAANSDALRWGTNKIKNGSVETWVSQGSVTYKTECLEMDFDQPGSTYEAALAAEDSGGGWFVKTGEAWQAAAMSAYVEHDANASRYSPPELNWGVRLGAYASWITSVAVEPGCVRPAGDVNGDCVVNAADLAALASAWLRTDCTAGNGWCGGADLGLDGRVDLRDLATLGGQWLACGWSPAWGCD